MIGRSTKVKLLAFAAVAVLTTAYLGFNYVGLDRLLLGSGYEVAADFEESGGIFVNAEVTYRGVAVGRVSDMDVVEDGVRVTMTIEPGSDPIPVETEAAVATRSAVGEQYVVLRPTADGEPYLSDGDVIPVEQTSIPVPVEQMLLNLDQFVTSIDQENMRIVVDELGRAFAGAGDDLGRLIDNGDLLLARATESLPETLRLITDGQTVLDRQRDSRSAIRSWAADLRLLSDTLVQMDPDLRSILQTSPDAAAAIETLIEEGGPGLAGLVRNLDILNTEVQIPRLEATEQLLITYPDVVTGGFTVVRREADQDGNVKLYSHFAIVLESNAPPCQSGYVPTQRTPGVGAVNAVNTDTVRCLVQDGRDPDPADDEDENGASIRGEQNIGSGGGRPATTPEERIPVDPRAVTLLDDLLSEMMNANPVSSSLPTG